MTRLDVGEGRSDTRLAHQIVDILSLFGHHQSDDRSVGTCTCSTARAMQECLVFSRRIDVDDEFNTVHMDTACGDVGCHHDRDLSRAEGFQVFGANAL